MNETQFKDKLVRDFRAGGNPSSIIWKHDTKFKAGWPDLYWKTSAFQEARHWELKVFKGQTLPDPRAPHKQLATELQLTILKRLADSGSRSAVVVLHEPPHGEKTITVAPLNKGAAVKVWSYQEFWRLWGMIPQYTFIAEAPL